MKILLVRPNYPSRSNNNRYGNERLNHKYFPIGLLKMSTYFKEKVYKVDLIIGAKRAKFTPDIIYITTLFTYWRKFTIETIDFYKKVYPEAEIIVGGVDASLNSQDYECLGVRVYKGIFKEVEKVKPDYGYFTEEVSFQILNSTRGCIKRCPYCGTYKVDGPFTYKTSEELEREIFKNEIAFYDNNLLANPNIKEILKMLSDKKINNKHIKRIESQSGFDASLLIADWDRTEEKESLFYLIKKARFINPRIAWDGYIEEENIVKRCIELFEKVGYRRKQIQVFMIYNWDLDFNKMEYKRKRCQEWGVQVSDCRYRPLDATFDNYNPRKKDQTSEDYYIHPGWTDQLIKEFRKRVRSQNIINRFLAKDKPLVVNKLRSYSISEVVLNEYCRKYTWRESKESPIERPLQQPA